MHTYIHACMHTYIHAYIHTYIHTSIHRCMHACMHTCMHTLYILCLHPWPWLDNNSPIRGIDPTLNHAIDGMKLWSGDASAVRKGLAWLLSGWCILHDDRTIEHHKATSFTGPISYPNLWGVTEFQNSSPGHAWSTPLPPDCLNPAKATIQQK